MSTNKPKISSYISGLVSLLFFFLPFEQIPTFDFAGFTVKISYIFGFCLLIVSAIGFKENLAKVQINRSDIFLALFWLTGLVSLREAIDLKKSLAVILMWLFVFLIYFVLSRLLTDKEVKTKAENYLLIATGVVAIFGLYQFIGDSLGLSTAYTGLRLRYTKEILGFPRVQSVALEPLYFANFLFVPLYIAMRRYLEAGKTIFNQYFYLILLILVDIILAISRGAYLALAISGFIFVVYLLLQKKENYRPRLGGLFLSIIIAAVLSLLFIGLLNGKNNLINFQNHALVNDSTNSASVEGREVGYQFALDKFKSSPILGIGIGNSGYIKDPVLDHGEVFTYASINNEYLEILSETGIIGLIFFLLFLASYLVEVYTSFKRKNTDQKLTIIALSLGLLAIFIQYNFFSTLYIIYIWAFLALLKSEAQSENN